MTSIATLAAPADETRSICPAFGPETPTGSVRDFASVSVGYPCDLSNGRVAYMGGRQAGRQAGVRSIFSKHLDQQSSISDTSVVSESPSSPQQPHSLLVLLGKRGAQWVHVDVNL